MAVEKWPEQEKANWVLSFIVPKNAVEAFEEHFADETTSVASFEIEDGKDEWKVDIFLSNQPDEEKIRESVRQLGVLLKIDNAQFSVKKLEDKDWIIETIKSFPPIPIGRFFIYGSHFEDEVPASKIGLLMDAGIAFGSGEHHTTSSCLKALLYLKGRREFRNILDMGSGSGTLSFASAKIWNACVLGIDIDEDSVKFSREYAKSNHLNRNLFFYATDGYKSVKVKRAGKYDLIVSNILARPLMKFAKNLKANLAPGGYVVLSGLTVKQQSMVIAAHRMQGLRLQKRILKGGWATLILK